jgi:hypothetical protein
MDDADKVRTTAAVSSARGQVRSTAAVSSARGQVRSTAAVSSARGQVRSAAAPAVGGTPPAVVWPADPGAIVAMGSGLAAAAGHDVLALRRETGHGSAGARHGGPV